MIVAPDKLVFCLADEQGRCWRVQGDSVVRDSMPYWMKKNPEGWMDTTLQWATNQKYFSTGRMYTNALKFVGEGEKIILDRIINGRGTEEIIYLIVLRRDLSAGLNHLKLEYKSRLDLSKWVGIERTGQQSVNTLQDDVFAIMQACETTPFSIPCNSSNPAAIKILFDGILMQDKFNYNFINAPVTKAGASTVFAWPIAFINNEGDSVGIVSGSQNFENPNVTVQAYVTDPANSNYLYKPSEQTLVSIRGTFSFTWSSNITTSGGFQIFFTTSHNSGFIEHSYYIFSNNNPFVTEGGVPFNLVPGKTYTKNFNVQILLAAEEKLFVMGLLADNSANAFTIKPLVTNLSINFSSKATPTVNYGLRPLDAWQQLIQKATNGKFTGDSNFFRRNNRKILISGSSFRNFPDAQCQFSMSDFFQSYSSQYCLGLVVRNGVLYIEPLEDIYNSRNEIYNCGEVSEVEISVASELIFGSARVGYVKQTYNKRNGRYEYNCTHNYKLPINTSGNVLNLVSVFRGDAFGAEFIRTAYPNLNSTDDKGDHDLWMIMISDEVGQTNGEVSTAVSFTVETIILAAPILKTPYSGTTVFNEHPTITGTSQPNKLITIFVDGTIDGTVLADSNGNWNYTVARSLQSLTDNFNGVHTISANAQTDPGNVSSQSQVFTIIVNTSIEADFIITGPTNNDTLYNNLPIIKGLAPAGRSVTVKIDGIAIGTVVSSNSSLWQMPVPGPIADGAHIITAIAPGLADAPAVNITVNKNVATPLITSIVYGDLIFNNLPLIKGVAIPGTVVSVYLDGGGGPIDGFGVAAPMGTAIADANGDWTFQVVSVFDSSGIETDYIPDGLHVVSTTALPVNVLSAIAGYRLMRGENKGPVMDFDGIKLDDEYIPAGVNPSSLPPTLGQFTHTETLYNIIESSPLRMLMANAALINSPLINQKGQVVNFTGAEINANLVTEKNHVLLNEGANVNVNDFNPGFFIPYKMKFKSRVRDGFNDVMTGINRDGYITTMVRDTPIYLLPYGKMTMKPATDEAQTWDLLISSKTPLSSILEVFASGLNIKIGKNMLHTSTYNPLHFVKYNFTPAAPYHFADIYDDWQKNRFKNYLQETDYVQPWTKSRPIELQFITNGVGPMQVHMINSETAAVVNTFPVVAVGGSIVKIPNVLQEVKMNVSGFPDGEYWFAIYTGGAYVAIAEKIDLKADHPGCLVMEYDGSEDEVGYFFSTGIKPVLFVHAMLTYWDFDSEYESYESDNASFQRTRNVPFSSRFLQVGTKEMLVSDFMRMKINAITGLSYFRTENMQYTRTKNSKLEKQDSAPGVVNNVYKMELLPAENVQGATFATPTDPDDANHTTAWTVDGPAFGFQAEVIDVITTNNP